MLGAFVSHPRRAGDLHLQCLYLAERSTSTMGLVSPRGVGRNASPQHWELARHILLQICWLVFVHVGACNECRSCDSLPLLKQSPPFSTRCTVLCWCATIEYMHELLQFQLNQTVTYPEITVCHSEQGPIRSLLPVCILLVVSSNLVVNPQTRLPASLLVSIPPQRQPGTITITPDWLQSAAAIQRAQL